EAAGSLASELSSGAAVDSHMADQMLPYLAVRGGSIKVPAVSSHAAACIHVINKFGFKMDYSDGLIHSP
ncbi:MAG: RNA 3'-terminal phosphate cyclase, partial [Candidatus Altiarchaeota archaeon]|nr:RNA 3'-terminal phosphate cyclase [Candidatus Altiarchaeota archaeon]